MSLGILPVTNSRRFPAPWHVDRIEGGFVVRDASNFTLCYIYAPSNFHELGTAAAGHLSPDEARRIANGIARLPELLGKERQRPE